MIKVIFNFKHHIATAQENIELKMPIEHLPKRGDDVCFDFELAEDLDMLCQAADIQYLYDKSGLVHVTVYLKDAEND
jgi:hypothetical protein